MAKLGRKSEKEIPTSQIIQVNPYEIPERTLQVATRISTANSRADASIILKDFTEKLLSQKNINDNIFEFLRSIESHLFDKDFWLKLRTCLQNIRILLEAKENTEYTQIVVAGSFSSGKSSFLNSILEEPNLLPTDIEAASVVPTYLYCTKHTKDLLIKGVNFRNAVVGLDRDVLKCIQHGSKSNAYISPLLKRLLIEIHSVTHDGIAYIDTPGYNNNEKMVDDDQKTDRQTAINTLKEGNVLFWLRDIEDGAISSADRKVIEQFNGRIVIIFNKADLKPESEIKKIINNAQKDFNAKSKNSLIIDIIAYSSTENKLYYSMRGYNMTRLLKKIKTSGTGQSEVQRILKQIDLLFDTELNIQAKESVRLKELWKECNARKDLANRHYIQNRDSNTDILDSLLDLNVKGEEYNRVKSKLEELDQKYQKEFDYYDKYCVEIDTRRKKVIEIKDEIARFKKMVYSSIRRGIKLYKESTDLLHINKSESDGVLDVFSAIKTRNMNSFLDCFADGLDIVKTLHDGYNPLTYAVKYGENDMVKFFDLYG
jgi:GTPase Era involved in 16S rRNA processing